jgi:putative salt-induced outer membrane protein YdiY
MWNNMRYFLIFILISSLVYGEVIKNEDGLVEVKDTSGLSEHAIREKIKRQDKQNSKKVLLEDIAKVANNDGTVDIKKIQALWENQSPTPNGYDWVQTKSGEWFKGHIEAMFNDELDFDSDEIGKYTFDFEDVTQIKSYHTISVNIDGVAEFTGIIRLKNDKIRIIQGDKEFVFLTSQIVSFAHKGKSNLEYWTGKISIGIDQKKGNTDQFDYSASIHLKRRTSATRLVLDYLGNMSSVNNEDTANNHRINEVFDIFVTKQFFWTPLFSEYYKDKYQNIDAQLTAGMGIGYTFIDTKRTEWSVSSGPGVIYTKYVTVYDGLDATTAYMTSNDDATTSVSLETRTKLEIELTKKIDFTWDHKFTITDNKAGKYKHHMVTKLETEITSWLDFDITYIWDYLEKPEKSSDGTTPEKNDFQLIMGLGIEF